MTDQAQQAILQGAMGVAMALAIGYVLYRIIKTKDSPSKASDYGRNWMAWIVMISTMATLPNAINNPSPDTIAKGVVALIVFSLIAFLVGFAYGKFKLRKTNTSTNKPTPNKTVANTDIQSNKTICSECGAEIKPANAKFCGRCGAKVERPKQVASKTINAEVVKPPTIEKQVVNNDKTPTPVKPVQTTSQSKPLTKHTKSKAITRSDSSPYKAIIITFIVLAVFVVALQKYNTYSNNTPYGTFTYDNGDVYTGELKNGKPTFKDGYQFKTSLERAKNKNEIIENLKNNITESKNSSTSNTKNINKDEYEKYKKTVGNDKWNVMKKMLISENNESKKYAVEYFRNIHAITKKEFIEQFEKDLITKAYNSKQDPVIDLKSISRISLGMASNFEVIDIDNAMEKFNASSEKSLKDGLSTVISSTACSSFEGSHALYMLLGKTLHYRFYINNNLWHVVMSTWSNCKN